METGKMPVLRWLECSAQKEVTSGLSWVITFLWAKSPKFLKNEAFVVIGKAAQLGHRENPA
jgi:hypothetical protein